MKDFPDPMFKTRGFLKSLFFGIGVNKNIKKKINIGRVIKSIKRIIKESIQLI